jgi:hypothetical protein
MSPDTPTSRRVSRIVRVSAVYDLVVTIPFATPWTARATAALLGHIHIALGLGGVVPRLTEPTAVLFASLMGSLVVVWSLVRLRAPTAFHGAADTLGRLAFAAWMTVTVASGGSTIVLPLLVLEIGWAIAQGAAVVRAVGRRHAATLGA